MTKPEQTKKLYKDNLIKKKNMKDSDTMLQRERERERERERDTLTYRSKGW